MLEELVASFDNKDQLDIVCIPMWLAIVREVHAW